MSISLEIEKKFADFDLNVSFEASQKRIGILGESGSGKSMTLKSIAGIVAPDRGTIRIDDRVLFDSAKKINVKTQKRKVGYLFQNYALFPNMTVAQNISAGLRGSRKENAARVALMIERFELKGLEKRYPGELSGGQQQRTALARIMAYQPDVILLDEPFSALDVFLKDRLQQELFNALNDYPGTCIMVSHDRDEIYRFSDTLLIIDKGRVVSAGPTRDIFSNPGNRAAARLTGCKNIALADVVDSHSLFLPEWNLSLSLNRAIPRGTRFIGYRAHDFVPVWGKRVPNAIPFTLKSFTELQFERKYYLSPKKSGDLICCFVHREHWNAFDAKGRPDFLQLDENKIMFLE